MLVLVVLLFCVTRGVLLVPLQASCPEMCRCDLAGTPRKVDCSGLGLTVFPSKLHISTQHLDLSNNSLITLPSRLYSSLPQLETLLLSNNQINYLNNEVFRGLQDLRTVDLSFNSLSDALPNKLIQSNPRMLELRVRQNKALINPGTLQSNSLEVLDLSGCNITSLNGSTLQGLTSIRTFNLSLNPLEILPDNLTSTSLRVLDLTFGKLLTIPSFMLTGTTKLQQLHISSNPNLDLPKNPSLISKSLLQLTADHCNIQHVSISNLPSLTHAYLSCNKITNLKRENFARNSALLEIDLGQNLIRELPVDVFLRATHLVSVDLSSNHIESLQYDSFACCKELKFLNLSRNDITKLPEKLTMPTLVVFDLSRCRLISLPSNSDFLDSMTGLQQFYLAHNELQFIPDLVSKNLKTLDLSYCHLKQVTNYTFNNLIELQRLDLSGNRITSLNANVFKNNKKLGTLKLDDNPWRCNCSDIEFQSLYDLAEQLSETGRNQLKCNDPEELSGKLWEDACSEDQSLRDETNNWLLSITLFLTLCALAGVMVCTKRLASTRHKPTNRTRRQVRNTRINQRDSDSSDDEPSIRVPRIRVESTTTQCTPCSEGLRNQRRLAAEVQPPTYEEAVLMPASTSNINIASNLTVADFNSNNEINVIEYIDGENIIHNNESSDSEEEINNDDDDDNAQCEASVSQTTADNQLEETVTQPKEMHTDL